MLLDSLINKEARLLKKVQKLYDKGEKNMARDKNLALSQLIEALNEIEEKQKLIRDKKGDFSIVLSKIGNLLSELGDYRRGDEAFKLSIEYDTSNIWAYIYYSRSLARRKAYDMAQRMVDKALTINRKSREAWETKAMIYESMGDVDEALKIYRNLIALYPEEVRYYESYLKYKPNDEEILVKKGILHYNKGDYINASKTMETVVNISPNNKEAYLYLGASYEKLEKYEEAIRSFKKVISLDPENQHAWVNLSVIYKRRGEYEDSLSAVKEGIRIDPNNAGAWRLRAEIEMEMNNTKAALESINQAISLEESVDSLLLKREILKRDYDPKEMSDTCYRLINLGKRDPDIYFDLAKAYYDSGEYDKASKVIDSILSASPHHLPTLILQKKVLMAMERWESAITTGEKILEIDPKNIETYVDIAKCYEKLDKKESALHFMKKATENDPKNVELWRYQRDLAKELNKPHEVVNACLGLTSIVEDFDAYVDLSKAYYQLGRFSEAKKIMEKALRISESAEAWNLYGMINYKLKDFENAKRAFEKATELEPNVKKYWSNLGWILEKLEKYREAIECFDRAIEIDPGDMRIWYEKGVCLERLGEWEEALRCFDKALEINPKFTKGLLEKGIAHMELGHDEDALAAFKALLKLDPSNHHALYRKALIEYKRGNYEACMNDVEEAIKYEKNVDYLTLKKDCCKAVKNWDCVIDVSRTILDMDGRNMDAYRDLAKAYLAEGKVDSAINTYRRALNVFPNSEVFLYELKRILLDNERYADFVNIAKKILAINPEDFNTLLDLGIAYMKMERYDDAEDALLRALNIKKTKEICDALGDLFMKKGDYKAAVKYYADSLKIEADPEVQFKLAKAHYKLGELDLALKAVRRALRKKKEARYYLLGAKIYADRGDKENALKYGQEALNIEDSTEVRLLVGEILVDSGENMEAIATLKGPAKEGNIRAMELLALALERENRIDDAREMYRRILEKDKGNVRAYLGLGRINMSLEKYEDAKDAYLMAYKLDPKNIETLQNLAFIYEKLGDLREALRYVDLAIEQDPENKYLWNTKGRLLMGMKKYEDAKRAFEKALSIDPDFRTAVENLKDCNRIIEREKIEEFARKVLELEHRTGKKVTKKDAFKKLDIPLSIIPKVFKYIREEEPFSLSELSEEERKKFDKASLAIAKKLNKIEGIKLSEIIGTTQLSVSSAKKLLKYIETCLSTDVDSEPTAEDERLVKKALDLDIKNLSLLNIMMNLEIGVCQARKIQKLLKEFFEEEIPEEESVSTEEEEIEEESEEEPEEEEEESGEEEEMLL